MTYVPAVVHHSIRWNKSDPMLEPIEDDIPWKIIQQSDINITNEHKVNVSKFIPVKGSMSNAKKRKRMSDGPIVDKPVKRLHIPHTNTVGQKTAPCLHILERLAWCETMT